MDIIAKLLLATIACAVIPFVVVYLGYLAGLWTGMFRLYSAVDYEDLTPTFLSDAPKTTARRGSAWL